MTELTQEIYTQLLELYARDLEVENISLYLQVVALEQTKTYTTPSLPYPGPTPWPSQQPIWCVT